jgi:hypothetical protein
MTTASATRPRATRTGRVPRRLTDEELTSLMGLLRGADSTELKLTVPPASHRDTIQGLPIDPVETQPRQVYFFDTPDLALNRAGLVVRARRIQGGKGDTVIKLRPVDPADLSPEIRADASFNVEVDVLPGGYVCSASFKGKSDGTQIWDAVRGGRPLRKLFSKPQRAFYQQHAPEGIDLDALIPLGPTFSLKGRFDAQLGGGSGTPSRSIVVELWLYPDGSRILELSTKCPPSEAFNVAAETRAYLAGRGVVLTGVQQTKTRTALEYYAKQLAKAAEPKAT